MPYPERKRTDREYMEMIYSLMTEMNGALMAQVRQINNSIAKVLLVMVDIQNAMNILNTGLKDTRDKRYQEEIDQLEEQISGMKKQIEEKKAAKQDNLTTSQEIRSIAIDVLAKQTEEAQKTQQLKVKTTWEKRKDAAVTAIIVTFAVGGAVALFVLLLPFLQNFLEALSNGLK